MANFVMGSLALLVALASSLTWVPAPPWTNCWKLAIGVGEFGHWLLAFPLLLAAIALHWLAPGPWQFVVLGLCVVAVVQLLRPAVAAAVVARRLPEKIATVFPRATSPQWPAFSVARLFWRRGPVSSVAVRTEIFARHGGAELSLDFYPASGNPAEPVPCIIVVHGGGWDGGDRLQLSHWNVRLASRGYAVAAISYRLAPEFRWPAQREDLLAAIAWVNGHAARLGVDPTRLVLFGRSAGGQIASAVAYGNSDPAVRGAVLLYAPHDMQFAWSVSRADDALNSFKLLRQYFGRAPDDPETQALYDSASAQLMVGTRTPPTLIVHGRPDTLVWHRHSERLAKKLSEAGVPHYYLSLPWATHGFDFNADGPGGQLADYAIMHFLDAVTSRRAGATGF